MVETVLEIISITNEDALLGEFQEFEAALRAEIDPLRRLLRRDIMAPDMSSLMPHMSAIEVWREPICHYLMLVDAFVRHAKSSNFLQPGGRAEGVNEFTRTAYQKRLTAGMEAVQHYLENLIDCIDEAVNQVKKVMGIESDVGGRRLQGARA